MEFFLDESLIHLCFNVIKVLGGKKVTLMKVPSRSTKKAEKRTSVCSGCFLSAVKELNELCINIHNNVEVFEFFDY